jgi:pilus assembly protein Flp/PilA
MNTMLLKMYVKAQNLKDLMRDEEGQDLVEYALLVALISLGAIVSVGGIATQIKDIFVSISTTLASATTTTK